MPISTSLRSGSTAASRAAEASCSTGCWNRPSLSSRFLTNPWSNALETQTSKTTRYWGHLSQVNTHLLPIGPLAHQVGVGDDDPRRELVGGKDGHRLAGL